MLDQSDLSGKNILITGAAFDIGKVLCLNFARLGATLLLLDHDAAALDAVYDEIVAQSSAQPTIVELDLAELTIGTAASINDQLIAEFGQLDALIHTANWAFPLGPLAAYKTSIWEQAMHHLHYVPFLLSQQLLPSLSVAKAARVVFTVHSCGQTPKAFWGPYGAAHAALQNTCDTWNIELKAQRTRFTTLDPGNVLTQVRVKHYPAEPKDLIIPADDPDLMGNYLNAIS